jgi:hypothetical protein
MVTVPLSQPYIPKTMGHMVWVCGTAVAWLGTLVKLSLENKDLAIFCGTALGTIGLVFSVFQVSQLIKKIKALGHSSFPQISRAGAAHCTIPLGIFKKMVTKELRRRNFR